MKENSKKMILIDVTNDREYIFTIEKVNDTLHFIIKEKDDHCPYIFEKSFELDDFIRTHKAFKSCDNISEVEQHFYILYKKEKLCTFSLNLDRDRDIQAKIGDISEEVECTFTLDKKYICTEKNIMELYEIYKKDKELKAKIKSLITKNLSAENPLTKDILKLIDQA